MRAGRPQEPDLLRIRLPVGAWVFSLHRLSGAALAPAVLLYALMLSLRSEADRHASWRASFAPAGQGIRAAVRCGQVGACRNRLARDLDLDVCPKGLNPPAAIGKIKAMLVNRIL